MYEQFCPLTFKKYMQKLQGGLSQLLSLLVHIPQFEILRMMINNNFQQQQGSNTRSVKTVLLKLDTIICSSNDELMERE